MSPTRRAPVEAGGEGCGVVGGEQVGGPQVGGPLGGAASEVSTAALS